MAHLEPLVTVGVTCYNAEETIERAVNSALTQKWQNLEVLVVDDASSDLSRSILEHLSEGDRRLRLIHHKNNVGAAAARNTLINEATGEFLVFFDDDDVSDPERIALQQARIERYEKETGERIVACYASGKRCYPNGYTIDLDAIGSKGNTLTGEIVTNYILFNGRKNGYFYGSGTPTCSLMARREVFLSIGGFDPNFRRVEDMDFAIRLSLIGGHFIGCPESLFTQYSTISVDKSPEANFKSESKLLEKYRHYLEQRNRYHYAKNWFLVRYHHFRGAHFQMLMALFSAWVRHPILVSRHFISSAPRRLIHELKMSKLLGKIS